MRRPTGWRPRRCTGLQTKVREDLLDHRLFQNRGDDLQLAAAVRAVLQVELKHALEQPRPTQPHRAVVRTVRLALGGRRGLRGRIGLSRHHLRAQLGVGCQHAVEADAAVVVAPAPPGAA